MKILHYIADFSLPSETFIYDLIQGLENNDLHNIVLTHRRHLAEERLFKNVITLENRPTGLDKILSKLTSDYGQRFEKYIAETIRQEKPDIIHAHFATNGWRILRVLKKYGIKIPVVISAHGSDINQYIARNTKYRIALIAEAKSGNCLFIANSHFLKQRMIALGLPETAICVLYNAVRPEFLQRRKTKFFKPGDMLKIVSVGRFVAVKGHSVLLQAFARFRHDITSDSHLTLVGYGPLENALKKQTQDLGIADHVTFTRVMIDALPEMLATQDVYIQPSLYDVKTGQEEGFGLATLEAIAIGLTVIASHSGGLPEVIGKENDFARYVPPADPDALFHAMAGIKNLTDNSVYAQERLAFFTFERLTTGVEALYRQLLTGDHD